MFCEKIRFLREHQELSQGEVAKRLNLTQASYSRYERGTNEPNLDTLKRIAKFFDCTVDYLLEMDDISSDNDNIPPPENTEPKPIETKPMIEDKNTGKTPAQRGAIQTLLDFQENITKKISAPSLQLHELRSSR